LGLSSISILWGITRGRRLSWRLFRVYGASTTGNISRFGDSMLSYLQSCVLVCIDDRSRNSSRYINSIYLYLSCAVITLWLREGSCEYTLPPQTSLPDHETYQVVLSHVPHLDPSGGIYWSRRLIRQHSRGSFTYAVPDIFVLSTYQLRSGRTAGPASSPVHQ
jgi:hypothetical protein